MKVRTKICVTAALPVALAIVVAAIVIDSSWRKAGLQAHDEGARRFMQDIFELTFLTHDYLLYPTTRAEEQWRAKYLASWDAATALKLACRSPREAETLDEIRRDLRNARIKFGQIVALPPHEPVVEGPPTRQQEWGRILAGQLVLATHAMVSTAGQLGRRVSAELEGEGRRTDRLILFTIVIIADIVAAISFVTGLQIARSLRQLHEGTGVIASGNLDHRVEVSGNDEIGELSRAFNAMAESLRRSYAELQKMVRQLEAHDRERSEFVSNVSHELRTPLTSMRYASANLIKGVAGPLPERVERYVRMIHEDCHRLSATVEDILDLGRIEAKALKLHLVTVPFARLVHRSVESLRVQAEAKSIQLIADIDQGARFVRCDPLKMERVIMNIVGNAIKFTPEGGTIEVRLFPEPSDAALVALEVRDSGIGIAPQHLGKVGQKYYRVGEHVTGTGLGLSIAREIVELHKGRLTVTSPPPDRPKGTLVSVHLQTAEPPLILVADDDADARRALVDVISACRYRVVACANGREALDAIHREKPDMAILDLFMPVMDGEEVVFFMKAEPSLRRVPILIITGGALDRAKYEVLQGFGIPALAKPWHGDELLDRVESAFVGTRAFHLPDDRPATPPAGPAAKPEPRP